jgi:hypothetical protein
LRQWLEGWRFGNSQKKAPAWVLRLPLSQQAELLRGYIAADGWVDLKTQQVRLTSVCYKALLQVRKILARLGIASTIRQGLVAGQVTLQGRTVSCQEKFDLMFRDGASRLGYPLEDGARYKLKQVFVEDGFLWSKVERVYRLPPQEFVPIQTSSRQYLTAFGLSHNCDDMEDDEQVENKDRRVKFRRWFFRAAKQALGRGGRVRVHGTILHEDSLLARLQKNKTWLPLFYKAHHAFDDFSNILWVEAWPEKRLRLRRQEFIEDGDSAGYSQEFLNDPQDNAEAYLRRADFVAMQPADHDRQKIIGVAADFAVSKADLANRTCFVIGGKCVQNLLHVIDVRVGRWASVEILPDGTKTGWIEEMFSIQQRWNPEFFWVEDGTIWQAIKYLVFNEMREREIWLNVVEVPSVKDKATRGRTLQKRMRAGGVRIDKEAEWYPGYEAEMLKFTGASQAVLDDQFDATSLLAIGFERYMDRVEEEDFIDDEELSILEMNRRRRRHGSLVNDGRSSVTGY